MGAQHVELGELASLGPFFAVHVHPRGQPAPPPWQEFSDLTNVPDVLGRRVEAVRRALAHRTSQPADQIELRVAASVAHLGLVARLIAPMIGASTLDLGPISFDSKGLWWQDILGGPHPLSVSAGDPSEPVTSAVEMITEAVARFGPSPRVLWGNVGSAANSAATLAASARPDLQKRATAAADAVLADPRIDDGTLHAGTSFRRRSCCLIYRINHDRAAMCGDCVLAAKGKWANHPDGTAAFRASDT